MLATNKYTIAVIRPKRPCRGRLAMMGWDMGVDVSSPPGVESGEPIPTENVLNFEFSSKNAGFNPVYAFVLQKITCGQKPGLGTGEG